MIRVVDTAHLEEVVDVLESGGVVVLPTDTVYGVAAKVTNGGAVRRIFEIKQRDRSKAVAVLVPSFESAKDLAEISPEATESITREWPGPLTIVVTRSQSARGLWLGGDDRTIGLRMPDHKFLLEVLERTGPLAATSANPSGSETFMEPGEIAMKLDVDLVVDGGVLRGVSSRVVSFVEGQKTLR